MKLFVTSENSVKSILVALLTMAVCATLLYGEEKSAAQDDSRIKLGILNLQTVTGNADLTSSASRDLISIVTDIGLYRIYSQSDIDSILKKHKQKMPPRCNDPRCINSVGAAVGLDRMLYGTIDKNGQSYGVQLTLLDILTNQTIDQVSLQGEPQVSLQDVLRAAVNKLHGYVNEKGPAVTSYFGPEIHNEKEFLYSSAGVVGAGLLWGLVNYLAAPKSNGSPSYAYEDVTYTGISAAANQIPMFARPASLGNAYVARSDDAYGTLYNPAGLGTISGKEAVVAYQYRFGLNNIAASYVNRATREISFGQAFLYSGDQEGIFTEMYFNSAASYKFNNIGPFMKPISVGLNLKLSSQRGVSKDTNSLSVSGASFGAGLDLGLLWEMTEKIRYGLLIRDLPTINLWKNSTTKESYTQNSPATLQMGGTFQVGYSTMLICEGQIPVFRIYDDQVWKMTGGIEQNFFGLFVLRGGIQHEIQTIIQAPWKITGGFGLSAPTDFLFGKYLKVDGSYEYNTIGVFDVVNISLAFGF